MLYATIDLLDKKYIIRSKDRESIFSIRKAYIPLLSSSKQSVVNRKMMKRLHQNHIQTVVLDNQLSADVSLQEQLIANRMYIITGERLFKVLIPLILKNICELIQFPIEKIKVLVLMNEYRIENVNLIKILAQEVKQLSIVSQHYQKYQHFVLRWFEEYGYMVKLYLPQEYHNCQESFVINLDFTENEIDKIPMLPYAIYLSFHHKMASKTSLWHGIHISDVDLEGPGLSEEKYCKMAICEAKIYQVFKSFSENLDQFSKQNYAITGYIGENGRIPIEEFEKIGKKFT